jgi:uncharacterized protein (DUF2384 family)
MLTPAPLETDKPRTRQFRRRVHAPLLAPAAVARQGRVATLVWERLRDSAAATDFLNAHDQGLGGRPIDLAIADDAGFRAVVARLDVLHPAG